MDWRFAALVGMGGALGSVARYWLSGVRRVEMVEEAVMLRVYVGESDKVGRHAAYKEIVQTLRREGVWGATAGRGLYGYGKKSVLRAASPLRLSEDLPVIVEAVDSRKKIEAVLPKVAPLVKGGLIVTLPVTAYVRVE